MQVMAALEVALSCAFHLLSDPAEGETPLVPDAVNAASARCAQQGTADVVASLLEAVMEVSNLENQCVRAMGTGRWSNSLSQAA